MTPILAQRVGADRSFERLYRKHAGDVYRYALVVLRNQADAEDVTQTTFLNAYRAIANGEHPRSPQNWLIAIAHNVCRQRFRQSQRRPNEVAYEEEIAETVVEEDSISAEDIRRALGHLAFNQRAALVMRELEGRSYQEIAEILGVSVSAVETLIFRARRALREQLEEGITCHEAELAISKQLDGRLGRKERGTLRAHLRECAECAGFARSQRAQRGALKSLAAIPLPQSLAGLFGGGGTAVGTGLAVKAAAIGATAVVAGGVGYESVKHDLWRAPGSPKAGAVEKATPAAKRASAARTAAAAFPRALAVRHDQKPYRPAAVRARSAERRHHGRGAALKPLHPAKPVHKEVSLLPPSRGRVHPQKPVRPAKTHKPPPPTSRRQEQRPPKVEKPKASRRRTTPPPPPPLPSAAHGRGKSSR